MKKIISILLVGALSVSLVGCGGKKQESVKEPQKQSTEQKQESKSKEIEAVNYGESSDSENWNIKIKDVQEVSEVTKKEDGEESFKTEGKFVNILLEMKNISKEPISYSLTDFQIKDVITGKVYSIEDIGYDVAHELISEEKFYKENNDYITIMDEVNPDSTKITWITFDIPKEIKLDNSILINKGTDSNKEVYFKLK